jgi:hypothetical protein
MTAPAQAAPRLDPTRYPREYGLSAATRITWVLLGVSVAAIGAFFLVVLELDPVAISSPPRCASG